MLNFFDSVIEFLQVAWNFIVNLIQSLLSAIFYVTQAVGVSTGILAYMPAFIAGCGLAVVAIGVIKFLIGR